MEVDHKLECLEHSSQSFKAKILQFSQELKNLKNHPDNNTKHYFPVQLKKCCVNLCLEILLLAFIFLQMFYFNPALKKKKKKVIASILQSIFCLT